MLRGLATALLALRFRSPTPLLTAAGENVGFIHVWGLPWELDAAQVAKTLVPMLEETGAALLEPPVLPLDKRARRTGRALCRVRCDDVTATIASLHGKCVGSRWLDVRESDCEELIAEQRTLEEIGLRAQARAPQAFSQATASHAAFDLPCDRREVVLLCHEVRDRVVQGKFELNNLREGRVDVLARCIAAALLVSHGVRRATRCWLVLRDVDTTISIDGATVKGLTPDERSLAAALRRALWAASNGEAPPDTGWDAYTEDPLEVRLRALLVGGIASPASTDATALVVLHEMGASLDREVLAASTDGGDQSLPAPATILVLGDHMGFSKKEEALFDQLGAVRASVGPIPLLASHCIVLAHAALDRVRIAESESETRAETLPIP